MFANQGHRFIAFFFSNVSDSTSGFKSEKTFLTKMARITMQQSLSHQPFSLIISAPHQDPDKRKDIMNWQAVVFGEELVLSLPDYRWENTAKNNNYCNNVTWSYKMKMSKIRYLRYSPAWLINHLLREIRNGDKEFLLWRHEHTELAGKKHKAVREGEARVISKHGSSS